MDANMEESDKKPSTSLPVLLLIGVASVLAWTFGNPFNGFLLILAVGLVGLGGWEYWRHHRGSHS